MSDNVFTGIMMGSILVFFIGVGTFIVNLQEKRNLENAKEAFVSMERDSEPVKIVVECKYDDREVVDYKPYSGDASGMMTKDEVAEQMCLYARTMTAGEGILIWYECIDNASIFLDNFYQIPYWWKTDIF